MNSRIKEVRKALGIKSQQEFANNLGISMSNVASYESGRRCPSDAVIALICERYGVSEEWLRNGTGEMFRENSKDVQITNMLADVLTEEGDSFKRRLVSYLARLDKDGWAELEKMIDSIAKKS